MQDQVRPICGFDDLGEVFDDGVSIWRDVAPEHRAEALEVFEAYNRDDLSSTGIVPTTVDTSGRFTFQHEKYLVSYPAEWPSEMLRKAALFHLELFDRLNTSGIDLKDALPNNVLFDGTAPRFVDFLSLIKRGNLDRHDWLVAHRQGDEDLRITVLRSMFVPYFLTPLLAMDLGRPALAREMLAHQACNVSGEPPALRQVAFARLHPRKILRLLQLRRRIRTALQLTPENAYLALAELIRGLRFPSNSGYSGYYESKGEDFPLDSETNWLSKQRAVAATLRKLQPRSVLDIGANTGWFSRLAERYGASVVSLDIDEASLNTLYDDVAAANLNITPLVIPFSALYKTQLVEKPRNRGKVFFDAPIRRLQSEVTLALGLIHHLALGEGRSLASIMTTFAELSTKALVLEFVSLDDPLIIGNPDYFDHLGDWTAETYSLDAIVDAAGPHFELISTSPSHPETRQIVTFRRVSP